MSYAGCEQPEPLDHPCHKIVRVTASGETWQVFLDPESRLPALVQANAANGDLLERYLFRTSSPNPTELAAADAFDPNRRWGEPKGLLHRLARVTASRRTGAVHDALTAIVANHWGEHVGVSAKSRLVRKNIK